MPFYCITRPFTGAGVDRVSGEVVDTESWRNVVQLVERRMLRPMTTGEESNSCECGRSWLTRQQARKHCARTRVTRTKEDTVASV